MKNKFTRLIAAVGLLSLAPGIASAGYLTFDFQNEGEVDVTQSCGTLCSVVKTTGTASELLSDEVPGTSSWSFTGYMKFIGWPIIATGGGQSTSTGWSFVDNSGDNDLFGTLTMGLVAGVGAVTYQIDGGSGIFAGSTGTGASLITVTDWFSHYFEVGRLWVTTPSSPATSVPEPGITGVLAAGLIMLGFTAYRRRRAQPTLK